MTGCMIQTTVLRVPSSCPSGPPHCKIYDECVRAITNAWMASVYPSVFQGDSTICLQLASAMHRAPPGGARHSCQPSLMMPPVCSWYYSSDIDNQSGAIEHKSEPRSPYSYACAFWTFGERHEACRRLINETDIASLAKSVLTAATRNSLAATIEFTSTACSAQLSVS